MNKYSVHQTDRCLQHIARFKGIGLSMFGCKKLSALSVVLLLSIAGCGNLVKVDMLSEKNLNSLSESSALPVVVRIYQLNDDAAFKSAGFRDMWKRDAEVLGGALLSTKEVVMQPGTTGEMSFPLDGKTKFIAGIAIFRNGEAARWNFILPVSDNIVASYWHKLFPVSFSLRLSQSKIEVVN